MNSYRSLWTLSRFLPFSAIIDDHSSSWAAIKYHQSIFIYHYESHMWPFSSGIMILDQLHSPILSSISNYLPKRPPYCLDQGRSNYSPFLSHVGCGSIARSTKNGSVKSTFSLTVSTICCFFPSLFNNIKTNLRKKNMQMGLLWHLWTVFGNSISVLHRF